MPMIGAQKIQQEFSGITDDAVVAKVRAGEAALFEVLCLAISEEAVKVRLHRARSTLRRSVDARISEAARQSYLFLVPRCDAMVQRVFAALGYAGG